MKPLVLGESSNYNHDQFYAEDKSYVGGGGGIQLAMQQDKFNHGFSDDDNDIFNK